MLRSAVHGSCAAIGACMIVLAEELPKVPYEWTWRVIGFYLLVINILPGVIEAVKEAKRCGEWDQS